jgi:hypothetical protein
LLSLRSPRTNGRKIKPEFVRKVGDIAERFVTGVFGLEIEIRENEFVVLVFR